MANSGEVLNMLIPQGGWITSGNEYEGVQFIDCEPITKAEFEAGFAKVDQMKAEAEAKAQADKISAQSKLAALGLTTDEIAALLK